MYNLPYYKEQNEQLIKEFIDQHPFAFLTGCDAENRPVVTQIPVFIEERQGRKILTGHMMRNTDHHKAFLHNENVLVVFSGAHAYVSATWYSNPHVASTWNYMSVHARGVIRFLNSAELEAVLQKVSLHFENYHQQSPTVFQNLPLEFKQKTMQAIVGFEIEITEMGNVFKLSQDRDMESYLNIIEKLKNQDMAGRTIATEMEKRIKEVFQKA